MSEWFPIQFPGCNNEFQIFCTDQAVTNLGIPQVLYFGTYGGYKVLITSLLGKTLHELKESTPKNKFSLNTVLKIAMQTVTFLPEKFSGFYFKKIPLILFYGLK